MSGLVYGSVCSGIEAASVAWATLGWRCAFLSEIEPFPRAVLKARWPEHPLHGDFTTIKAGGYQPIDLLVGGTPCQSFSVAGLRGGLDDDRGNLALEYLRLAQRLRPRWLVWENVPGVLSSAGGRDFGAILGGMVELGYGVAYRVLDAQFFGVPQRRRRVFAVGCAGDWRRAAAVLFERHSLSGHPAPRREAGEGAAATVAGGARQRGGYSHDDIPLAAFGGNDTRGPIEVATALNAHGGPHGRCDFESETFVASVASALSSSNPYGDHESREGLLVAQPLAFNLRGREGGAMPEIDDLASMRAASGGSSRSYVAFAQNSRDEVRLQGGDGQLAGALAAEPGMKQTTYVAFSCKDHGADAGELAPTLRSMGHDGSHANGGGQLAVAFNARQDPGSGPIADALGTRDTGHGLLAGAAVRRLTPRECERLQGFPDDYTLIPWRKGEAPDGPRYKALGNSMAVPVMRWIGKRIAAVEALSTLQHRKAA